MRKVDITLPKWVKEIQSKPLIWSAYDPNEAAELIKGLEKYQADQPLVSIIIPAWNEEEGILHTLWSLSKANLKYPAELIVVDNNSTDGTADLLKTLGVKTILETKQGVGHARTTGLQQAKGTYVLTGDSDTLYPASWINLMTEALMSKEEKPVYCVHSTYSFIPEKKAERWQYALYELVSAFISKRKEKSEPFLNVFGFYTGFVAAKGRELNGYDIEVQRTFRGSAGVLETNATEDGMMALRLLNAGGQIKAVHDSEAKVWTSDRRIQMDGGIVKAFQLRFKKYLFKK